MICINPCTNYGPMFKVYLTYMSALEKSLKLWLILAGRSGSPD